MKGVFTDVALPTDSSVAPRRSRRALEGAAGVPWGRVFHAVCSTQRPHLTIPLIVFELGGWQLSGGLISSNDKAKIAPLGGQSRSKQRLRCA